VFGWAFGCSLWVPKAKAQPNGGKAQELPMKAAFSSVGIPQQPDPCFFRLCLRDVSENYPPTIIYAYRFAVLSHQATPSSPFSSERTPALGIGVAALPPSPSSAAAPIFLPGGRAHLPLLAAHYLEDELKHPNSDSISTENSIRYNMRWNSGGSSKQGE
jgi:hypothetical protein